MRWAALALAVVAVEKAFGIGGVPTPALFAGFVVGIVYAFVAGAHLEPPRPAVLGAQAIVGVTVGTYMERSTLQVVGSQWLPVLIVCLVTLTLSVLGGVLLSRISAIDLATASFGMIAGGAAGIIAISRELDADEALVAVLQYLRVLIIVALTPIVATVVLGAGGSSPPVSVAPDGSPLAFLVVCVVAGIAAARLIRLPAGALLGPMFVAAAFGLSGSTFAAHAPSGILDVAFAVIGIQVGLRFTPASVRQAGSVLPAAIALVLGMILVCALLGVLLASIANVSERDGYLATTPGGLSAVLAIAVGTRANATFIMAVQVIRTFVMLLGAPLLARWISQRRALALGVEE